MDPSAIGSLIWPTSDLMRHLIVSLRILDLGDPTAMLIVSRVFDESKVLVHDLTPWIGRKWVQFYSFRKDYGAFVASP